MLQHLSLVEMVTMKCCLIRYLNETADLIDTWSQERILKRTLAWAMLTALVTHETLVQHRLLETLQAWRFAPLVTA